jgi:hypothetical protein
LEIYFMAQSYFVPDLPFSSALPALAFLGTAFLLAGLAVATLVAFVHGKRRMADRISAAGAACAMLYASALLAASLSSREKVLRKGDRKYFCEIDCHLAYSLEASSLFPAGTRSRAVATIRTWFDERTIGARRGNAPLTPNPRVVYALDEEGNRYEPSSSAETPLARALRPGESYTTTFVFDLPAGARRPRLFVGNAAGVELLLIGHENSLLHKKVFFEI